MTSKIAWTKPAFANSFETSLAWCIDCSLESACDEGICSELLHSCPTLSISVLRIPQHGTGPLFRQLSMPSWVSDSASRSYQKAVACQLHRFAPAKIQLTSQEYCRTLDYLASGTRSEPYLQKYQFFHPLSSTLIHWSYRSSRPRSIG